MLFTLSDRASTIPSNNNNNVVANPVSGLLDSEQIRGTSTKLRRKHENKAKLKKYRVYRKNGVDFHPRYCRTLDNVLNYGITFLVHNVQHSQVVSRT